MKTKFLASIIIGVIIFGSFSFVYGIMYDCLNPPMRMKIPKSDFRYCFGLLLNGHLPDYPNYATYEEYRAARDANLNFISEPTEDEKIINQFKDLPEVKAFFTKYDDANVSVRTDHISYFAGSHDDILVRMNLFFDKNYELDPIDFHCYYKRTHLVEIAQEDIVYFLENRDCKKPESEEFMGKSLN